MKFPGQRKHKHYFPVDSQDPRPLDQQIQPQHTHICGIAQTLVDIEARVDDGLIQRHGLVKGNSVLIDDDAAHALYRELKTQGLIVEEHAGGTIGNTLHNFATLSNERAVLFAVMERQIEIGSYAYKYLSHTSSKVDVGYLQPVEGPIGRCFTLITPCGERSFAISKGAMDKLEPSAIRPELVREAGALVFASYLMRSAEGDNIDQAALKAMAEAKAHKVPVVLTLGTRFLIEQDPQFWRDFIAEHVTVLAMNEEEAEALTGYRDPLKACEAALQWCDLVLCTAGPEGLYTAGYCDKAHLRATEHPVRDGAIPGFNRDEFSRPMRKADCATPVKVYSHIAPYLGGPMQILNTNGAGDGALAALLHDMAANRYHKLNVPQSDKHQFEALSYSSFAQICKYANRVSYEVLIQHSPRLSRALPEREDSLEESYWER
ncbi:inosine/guanosine kinase [Ferrimonas balearica]|uniref:inosine/guanosine kinase n=1 Tax=Ferrimonas balearica TaxID=44012 RepID=UPI001C99541D|nr:inosine/guanosine kinase [Ferrimonas balearica]MBY5990883.1 inosine/guanosine kinase [Ferrimonas balearica]